MSYHPPQGVGPGPAPIAARPVGHPAPVGGIVLGGIAVALGVGIVVLPYLLFLLGGGGDSVAFEGFARSFLIPGAVVIPGGITLVIVGAVRARRAGAEPGRVLGAVALVLSVLFSVAGLILGYVARARSRKAGVPNGLATGAIVIGWIGVAFAVICGILVLMIWIYGSSVQYP